MKFKLISDADIKYTFRLLAKKPGSALLAIMVLAGGLGVSILAFTVMYTFMYKDIPLTNGEAIYRVCAGPTSEKCDPFTAFEISQLKTEIDSLENVGIYVEEDVNVVYNDEIVDWVEAVQTQWNMFQLSQTDALLG